MQHRHIINSLPLLASILGRKYGVQVRIGGDRACTNGSTIYLPSLPLDCDETLLGLVRGMLDHEAAHIRDTDFAALEAAKFTSLEKHVWNILEDYRVENKLASLYPGCRKNFQWLIRHLFLPKPSDLSRPQAQADPAMQILEWLLITVRSWDVPELDPERDLLRAGVETWFPGLTHELESLMRTVPICCASTVDPIGTARDIVAILKRYAHILQQQIQQRVAGDTASGKQGDVTQALQSLGKLLAAGDDALPVDFGATIRDAVSGACKQPGERLQVAVATGKQPRNLSPEELAASRQATTALRTRLQALMQSTRSVRNHSGYNGKLDTRKLHTLASGSAKLFLRQGEQAGVNTAVHILLDSSGSMGGNSMELANQACFAMASALYGIKGVSLGVTAFPGIRLNDEPYQPGYTQTVAPVLRHGQRPHVRFGMNAGGGTPMDSALWWVMQQLHPMPEPRKIILLITDGEPDDQETAASAIKAARAFGFEVYGIGITTVSITRLLSGRRCRIISSINELASAMFAMLQDALISSTQSN